MGAQIVHVALCTAVKADLCTEARHQLFDFGVVGHHAVCLVAEQVPKQIRVESGKEVERDVHEIGLDAEDLPNGFIRVVSGDSLVAGDVNCFADGVRAAQQAAELGGEIRTVSHMAQRVRPSP